MSAFALVCLRRARSAPGLTLTRVNGQKALVREVVEGRVVLSLLRHLG